MDQSAHPTRDRILDAALTVIRTKGYSATTVDDICRASGLTKGGFFHHFKGKEDLAIAAAAHFSRLADGLFALLPERPGNDPLLQLLDYIDLRIAIIRGSLPQFTCLLGTMVQETYETHPAIRQACERHISHHAGQVAGIIAEAREHYVPDAKWSAESLALYTQATIQGAFILAKARHNPDAAVDCLKHLRHYIELLFEVPSNEKEAIMTKSAAPFVWYDLMTPDFKAAEEFYRAIVGWKIADSGMPGVSYGILKAGDIDVGGMMGVADGGQPPMWTGYIYSPDVDADAKRAVKLGGSVCRAPEDIPGVGRFAVIADPGGAVFNIFKPNSSESPKEVAANTAGHIGWCDLRAGDGKTAWDFYSKMFNWTDEGSMDAGPEGPYRMFATGKEMVGGMMTNSSGRPGAHWLFLFNVDAIDAAVSRVKAAGGKVTMEPTAVPGESWIIEAEDPQGAVFGLLAPKR